MSVIDPPAPATRTDYRPDALWKGTVAVEVKSGLHSFRNLRAGLLQLAYYLARESAKHAVLVLANSRISDTALARERELAGRALRPEVLRRLSIAVARGNRIVGLPKELDGEFRLYLQDLVARETRKATKRWRQPAEAVFLVLLNQWFLRAEPMTTRWLMGAVGCSYPTVATALRRLEPVIRRSSDRSVRFWGFPGEQLQSVVANLDRAHPTVRYVDRSGQRRSPEALLRRAEGLDRTDLAVGGVIAARRYYPELDLRGTPRLDLTLHCPDETADLSFVELLDPALERTHVRDGAATLAVHILRRREAFFVTDGDGLSFADRVSTLLDLYDARLGTQAKVLIFDEPTRGIDVGAKYEIYTIMNRLIEQGMSIMMISSELPEILGMSDRVYIVSGGRISGELPIEEATQEKIMELATN